MWRQLQRRLRRQRPSTATIHYQRHKARARVYLWQLLTPWSARLVLPLRRVAVRNTRRSWGSCSALGNLNFNYKLLFVPPCLAEYVVVHELCHLRELNHAPAFWQLVAAALPDYVTRVQRIRQLEKECRGSAVAMTEWTQRHAAAGCVACEQVESDILQPSSIL